MGKFLRLKDVSVFRRAFSAHYTYSSKAFVLKLVFSPIDSEIASAQEASLGIIATKKLGNAVKRNFIRRRLRCAADQTKIEFNALGFCADVVLIARAPSHDLEFSDLTMHFRRAFLHIKKLLDSKNL